MASIGLSRKDRSTAFLSHWLTVHPPPCFSAIRASPLSSAAMTLSTAWRTSPLVPAPIESRASHACSMTARSSPLMRRPPYGFEPLADIGDAKVHIGLLVTVIAALGAV